MLGVGGDGEHGLGAGLEQQIVDHPLVLIGDVGDRLWQGEDQVEVADRQELGLVFGEPGSGGSPLALRTVPISAAVERDHTMIAVLASYHVASERRGAAALDRAHHLELAEAQMAGMGGAPCGAVVAEDICDLQPWARHRCDGLRWLR